jgi:flavin-binding protein dodecin
MMIAPAPCRAAEPEPAPASPPAAETAPSSELACHDKRLTGSGPGFKSSQDESEEAAIKDWLDKARAIYTDADWAKTKEANMECVKQGLYSKCFATAIPCGTAKASAP